LFRRYGIALFFVAVALVSSLLLQRFFPYPFLFLFFAAVMASAWFGAMASGLFAVFISTLAVDYFFVPPLHSFAVNATDTAYFAAFIICAVVVSLVSSSKRKTEEELKGIRDQLQVRVAELKEVRDQLEVRVTERTAELHKSVVELQENERARVRLESEKFALTDKLETRKLVERAKGILQRELKISEQGAYRTMQRDSQRRRKSMREISELIILNDDLKDSSE
jgi:K+-sensing histidine kinase KdpD